MNTIKGLKKITYSLNIIGFIGSLFLYANTLGLDMKANDFKVVDVGSAPNLGLTILEELTMSYCTISICFLLCAIINLMRDSILLKVMCLIPLIFLTIRCGLLITQKIDYFKYKWTYSNWLETTYYLDVGFFVIAFSSLVLQVYLVRLIYHLSHNNS